MSLPVLPVLKRKLLPAAIACPWCASLRNKVDESRPNSDSSTIRRRRRCRACGQRWTTRERVVTEVEEDTGKMSQIGEAHKMLMRHLDWAATEMRYLEPWLRNNRGGDEEALHHFETATLHLDNARRLAELIDSGVVYSNKEEEGRK